MFTELAVFTRIRLRVYRYKIFNRARKYSYPNGYDYEHACPFRESRLMRKCGLPDYRSRLRQRVTDRLTVKTCKNVRSVKSGENDDSKRGRMKKRIDRNRKRQSVFSYTHTQLNTATYICSRRAEGRSVAVAGCEWLECAGIRFTNSSYLWV